jgi:hypothetical protein
LGLWSGRRWASSAFWHGAAVTFIAILTAGLITAVVVIRSSPYDQPAVAPPPLVTVAAIFWMAMMWGAVGGVFAYAASRLLKNK